MSSWDCNFLSEHNINLAKPKYPKRFKVLLKISSQKVFSPCTTLHPARRSEAPPTADYLATSSEITIQAVTFLEHLQTECQQALSREGLTAAGIKLGGYASKSLADYHEHRLLFPAACCKWQVLDIIQVRSPPLISFSRVTKKTGILSLCYYDILYYHEQRFHFPATCCKWQVLDVIQVRSPPLISDSRIKNKYMRYFALAIMTYYFITSSDSTFRPRAASGKYWMYCRFSHHAWFCFQEFKNI